MKFKTWLGYLLKPEFVAISLFLVALGAVGSRYSGTTSPTARVETIKSALAFTASQIDTFDVYMPSGTAAAAVGVVTRDSSNFKLYLDRLIYNSAGTAVVASADSINVLAGVNASGAGLFTTVTLSPIAETYRFRVAHGASDIGVSSATYSFKVTRTYYK